MGVFRIKADNFEWIGGAADDPQDLCLHGHVTVQFGDTVLEDTGTVSATALYLLKTLTNDKLMAEYDKSWQIILFNPMVAKVFI